MSEQSYACIAASPSTPAIVSTVPARNDIEAIAQAVALTQGHPPGMTVLLCKPLAQVAFEDSIEYAEVFAREPDHFALRPFVLYAENSDHALTFFNSQDDALGALTAVAQFRDDAITLARAVAWVFTDPFGKVYATTDFAAHWDADSCRNLTK